MVDFYAMPQSGDGAWPGRADAGRLSPDPAIRGAAVQAAIHRDVCLELGSRFDPRRFVPYVSMHEFEALLFSDCEKLAVGLGHPGIQRDLLEIVEDCGSPERINDSQETAPSKRLKCLIPDYDKVWSGIRIAESIGIEALRSECPHFGKWISDLEARGRELGGPP